MRKERETPSITAEQPLSFPTFFFTLFLVYYYINFISKIYILIIPLQVLEALDTDRPHFPAVSEPLRNICAQVEAEMNSCALPMLPDTLLSDLKSFSAAALRHLPMLAALMDLEPNPEVSQFSKDQPVKRVGTHRVATAELMAQLLRAECPSVVSAVGATGLLQRCVQLALERPSCSPLQCACLRALRAVVSFQCGSLGVWKPLIEGGNIPRILAAIASGAQGVSIGLRPPHTGFAIAVADILFTASTGKSLGKIPDSEDSSSGGIFEGGPLQGESGQQPPVEIDDQRNEDEDDGGLPGVELSSAYPLGPGTPPGSSKRDLISHPVEPWQGELAAGLWNIPSWVAFVEKEGPLDSLLTAQQQELAGPRPLRMNLQADMDAELAALGGAGQMISGQELLALLRGLNYGRMG